VGNADERFTTLAVENLLVELATTGRAPLALYTESLPFSTPQVRPSTKDRLEKHLTRYTAAAIPTIRLGDLRDHLSDSRRRKLFITEGPRFDCVLIRGSAIPESGLPTVADAAALFVVKAKATSAWVYQAARSLVGRDEILPIPLVVVNAGHLEEAAVFFQDVKHEVASLLKRDVPIQFAGYLNFDPGYADVAVKAGRSLVELFPGSPFHGQIKYILAALFRAVPAPSQETYFSRMVAWLDTRRG
jgi:MinD-like ATPase involved in chromosome partitioning or flagellar assembly